MRILVFYVGSSLLAPLKEAERKINRAYKLDLEISAHNFGASLNEDAWREVENELAASEVVFVIHVMDGENAVRLLPLLQQHKQRHRAVIVINCMPELMRRTHMGKLNVASVLGNSANDKQMRGSREGEKEKSRRAFQLVGSIGSWMGRQARANKAGAKGNAKANTANGKNGHGQYLKLVDRLPGILKFVPGVGAVRDVKNYLNIFCYFLQPTPANIRSMILCAVKEYISDARLAQLEIAIPPPEHLPSVAIYHPDAPKMFETFADYEAWYVNDSPRGKAQSATSARAARLLDPASTIGLLLMRPQVISRTTKHYDALIRAIEAEGLSVIPALSTLMDNREAVTKFFVEQREVQSPKSKVQSPKTKDQGPDHEFQIPSSKFQRVSQIVSLTGFSFVGGPAMNDSEAAAAFLSGLNVPYRAAVSLDMQTIDSWRASQTGLNPVQAGMQIAIPEIDGATEPFIYGGLPERGVEPVALDDRCRRYARRLARWNRLQTAQRDELTIAFVLFCFPPNKGNIGTAADLDVFPSLWETLNKLKREGYDVELPASADELRLKIINGNAAEFGATANVAYRMSVAEYREHCPYVDEIASEWGTEPGALNSFNNELLIQGIQLGKVFIGVQPTFGFEGDPMRLMMARSGAPHHGFMAFYTYLCKILNADAVVHVGTHGAMEFMPGKQVGLSAECWPDRLIGELPNVYLYSVNNPSEGSIAKRRSYAELISYLTPPMENAGVYRDIATLKELVMSYRQANNESEREKLFEAIDEVSRAANFIPAATADYQGMSTDGVLRP